MKLQFKHQPFQRDAAAAVCDVFNGQPKCSTPCWMDMENTNHVQQNMEMCDTGFRNTPLVPELTQDVLLKNLQAVQQRNGLKPSEELAGPGLNLTIEMETGTGKTYTYVKTMYELNARYGWSKFIVVVPSVAIREGVYKSLQTTQEHFAEDYGKKIRFFIYNSDRLTDVERFASDSAIHVMVINMQAFNSSKNQRIIDKKLDAFCSRRPIDMIAKTNPILIIDEPQSVEGKQTKESLKKFHALFTIRYSATHREKYDMVYRLDAMDAYNQHLVKKIAALGVTLTGTTATSSYIYLEGIDTYKNKAPTARIGFEVKAAYGPRTVVKKLKEGCNLLEESKGLAEYTDRYTISKIDARDNSVTFLNGLKLYAGQIYGNEQMTQLQRRIQIRETIRTHIQKERELYPKGIKVLSLFFIDEVAKYRLYDGDNDDGRNGEYAKIFEEEYENVVGNLQRQFGDEEYVKYLSSIDVHRTHQGYFSIDKKKGKKAHFVESKINNKKAQISEDSDAYDLIMKDKERLLSMEEPVRFLFSHSALREGWDNPNVFQICTLKPQSESEIRSRQEIGRGLRLCVNQQGERMDESLLGRDVQSVNTLTLITDLSFGKFAEALQAGLADSMADRPKKVDVSLFTGRHLTNANGEEIKVTSDIAEAIFEDLISRGYVKRGQFTEKYYEDKENNALQVAEEVKNFAASVIKILSSVYDSQSMQPENAAEANVEVNLDENKLKQQEFQALWQKINCKTVYTVAFDTKELIQNSIEQLNLHLDVAQFFVKKEYGEQVERIDHKEQLLQGHGFTQRKANHDITDRPILGAVKYDLIGKLVEETGLTRATVASILQGMAPVKFRMFRINPEDFILKTAKIINNEKASLVVAHIAYNKLNATYDTKIFATTTQRGTLGTNAMPVDHSIYDYLIYDSDGEQKFAKALEMNEKVAIYVKLPKSFFIPTPVGKYSPDWAIAFHEGTVKHVFFVAETKDSTDQMELRSMENAKIACARAHFKEISNDEILYDVVSDFDQLINLVS